MNQLLHPLTWLVILMVIIALAPAPWKTRLLYFEIGLLLLLTNPWIFQVVSQRWEPAPTALEALNPNSGDVIVLGGFTRLTDWPLDRLHLNEEADRLTQAVELVHLGLGDRLIFVSGGYTAADETMKEADLAVRTAERLGVPKEKLIALSTSLNTHENAVECREFFDAEAEIGRESTEPPLLVTSAFHARRARACFEKVGIEVSIFATGHRSAYDYPGRKPGFIDFLAPNALTLNQWQFLLREWAAMLVYRARGWI